MKDRSFNSIEDRVAHLREVNATLRTRLQEVEAGAAVMREALLDEREEIIHSGRHHVEERRMGVIDQALSTNAGKAFLERLQEAETTELHNMQLAGISTASIQNTESTVKDRITRDNPYWTVAYGDVCVAVDREMEHRKNLEVATQLLHDIASQDGWLRTDSTTELWQRLQVWKRDHPTK